MQRRSLVLSAALGGILLPARGRAQATGRLPPDAPGAEPRDDARFSAELLAGMAAGEAQAQESLARYPVLRTIRQQVPRRGWNGVEAHYIQVMLVERRWRDAGITRPQRSAQPFLPPQAWTDGKWVLALVGAHPTRAEDGLLPYSILTNLGG